MLHLAIEKFIYKQMKNYLPYLLIFTFIFSSCQQDEKEKKVDICIYGATSAGIIAAYTAAEMGKSVILIHPDEHIGGLTTGGLGQTDIGNKYAITGLSRDFYRRIGEKYGEFEQWTFEPHVAMEVFQEYLDKAGVAPIKNMRLKDVVKTDGKITSAVFENSVKPSLLTDMPVSADVFIDCTYEGDLMAAAGVSYTVGREANSTYGETYNGVQLREYHQFPDGVDPYVVPGDSSSGLLWGISQNDLDPQGTGDQKVQAYNFRVCLTNDSANLIPISRPEGYDSTWYNLMVRYMDTFDDPELFDFFMWSRMPNQKTDINNWGGFSTDMIGENHDYPEGDYETRKAIVEKHELYTKGLFYFLKSDPRVPENIRNEMKKWGLPKDEYMENNHWSPQLYIREARRMIGDYVMTEHNCLGDSTVSDGVGMAAYTMDSHNCQRLVVNGMVKNEGDVQIGGFPPYDVSYRSLTPKREECTNLLVPVCLSASHIAFGSIRMEPVFMVLAQSAAVAASMAIDNQVAVQGIDVAKLQAKLKNDPLLDGTPPEIVIDNSHAEFSVFGDTSLYKSGWQNKSYEKDFILHNPGSHTVDSAVFSLKVPEKGSYDVYYYCTSIWWYHHEMEIAVAEKIPLRLVTGKNETSMDIDYAKNSGNWVLLGNYELTPNQENQLVINAGQVQDAFGIDAVLLKSTP